MGLIANLLIKTVPARQRIRRQLRRLRRPAYLGTLRRLTPISDYWGKDRGVHVDRYYIERFLEEHSADIRGSVLEIHDRTYTRRYGSSVTRSEVLDIDPTNPEAGIIADLSNAESVASDQFDCFILTQTLQLILDTKACVTHAHRLLREGGVLLVTVPFLSRVVPQCDGMRDYWRFTTDSCTALFGDVFGRDAIEVTSHGNVLSAIAYWTGMAQEELTLHELEYNDPAFPVSITVRAVKRTGQTKRPQPKGPSAADAPSGRALA